LDGSAPTIANGQATRGGVMRVLLFLIAALATTAAQAQTSAYYAERGHWTVFLLPSACRALNRPPSDFNFAPYDALQIVVRPGAISVETFFWPLALDKSQAHRLLLRFDQTKDLTLDANAAMGDFMLASAADTKLWRLFEDAEVLTVVVEGEHQLSLQFELGDIGWVMDRLQDCQGLLPKS
jgi:hypothetical protein